MEKALNIRLTSSFKNYLQLTKPGIIMGNAITASGGFILASGWRIPFFLFLATLVGLSFVIASACVCNNFIDRDLDRKMHRTRNRVLPKGLVKEDRAILFSMILGTIGVVILFKYVNLLATVAAIFGFFVYVLLYSFSKYLTPMCTVIGSIAGSIPPVVGYAAIKGSIDLGAILIFTTIVMWQMPHFYAIAMYRLRDYKTAEVPVMPVSRGIFATKLRMLFYIVGFLATAIMLFVCKYVGYLYLGVATLLSIYWLFLSIKGFYAKNDAFWARKMFLYSLVVVMAICGIIPFSAI